jgi:hypothetical protein
MKPTSEDLYGALWLIGSEERDEPIRRETLARLAELKIIHVQPSGKPELTTLGWQLYGEMESGDAPPEFEQP